MKGAIAISNLEDFFRNTMRGALQVPPGHPRGPVRSEKLKPPLSTMAETMLSTRTPGEATLRSWKPITLSYLPNSARRWCSGTFLGPPEPGPQNPGSAPRPQNSSTRAVGARGKGPGARPELQNHELHPPGVNFEQKKLARKAAPRSHFSSTPGAAGAWKRLQSDPGLA